MNLLFFFMPGFYISKRTVINGNISTNENGRIDGIVNGDIESRAHLTIQKNEQAPIQWWWLLLQQ